MLLIALILLPYTAMAAGQTSLPSSPAATVDTTPIYAVIKDVILVGDAVLAVLIVMFSIKILRKAL
jgi:hypothetical protein